MLRIQRPERGPNILKTSHILEERRRILDFLRRDEGERRQRRDGLKEDIFYEKAFVGALAQTFRNKCAFCEVELLEPGRTLHMRPLRYVDGFTKEHREYYLWFAFEWRNLFYSCDECSLRKGNKFPIEGRPANFLASYQDAVKHERALLIDPTSEDPEKHLFFTPFGNVRALTRKGFETISTFDLDRSELADARLDRIQDLFAALKSNADKDFQSMLYTHAPHSGALRSILRRITGIWRPFGRSSLGRGDAFVRRFIDAYEAANNDDHQRLRTSIEEIENQALFPEFYQDSSSVLIDYIHEREWNYKAGEVATINIANFKAIENLSFRLPSRRAEKSGTPALMILGENSTGKSSILAAIALAAIGANEAKKLKKYLPALVHSTAMSRFDQLDERDVSVDISFHLSERGAAFAYKRSFEAPEGSPHPALKVLAYGPRRFFDTNKRNRGYGAAARVVTLFNPLATIPYPGDWLRAQTGYRFDSIASALRVVLALGDDDELIVEPDYLAVRANGRVTPIDALSEGYRSVFVMTVDIIRELIDDFENLEEAQALVLIDELETHLHPRWKMQVMTSLRNVFPKVQFIVTTHDPLCLRGMDDGEVMVLQRDQSGRIHSLTGLPSVQGMTAEQLLTSDYFGLASTTDPSTEIRLASLAGDVARTSNRGATTFAPAAATTELVSRLAIGNSLTEQIVQEALSQYLERREFQRGILRTQLRAEAVEAVLKALSEDDV
ncbi:AAA family ATPase [Pseudomonas putida]|uniref:AAA family ATPase n=1 Tax=Pseudomonas putida TaxID=303 RepID=UPI0013787319|nr:AAA family ATPase [Pseudomonas putida]NBA82294.1 AAA family ATPase [Pseudomonas putida]